MVKVEATGSTGLKGSMWLYSIYLGTKVSMWENCCALSIYYIATWILWDGLGFKGTGLEVGDKASRWRVEG